MFLLRAKKIIRQVGRRLQQSGDAFAYRLGEDVLSGPERNAGWDTDPRNGFTKRSAVFLVAPRSIRNERVHRERSVRSAFAGKQERRSLGKWPNGSTLPFRLTSPIKAMQPQLSRITTLKGGDNFRVSLVLRSRVISETKPPIKASSETIFRVLCFRLGASRAKPRFTC